MDEFIIRIFTSQWWVFFFVLFILGTAAEFGFRSGLRLSRNSDEKSRSLLSSLQASVLGLLALLLGFSFSMAVDRYDQRRDLVVSEANSIGTTYLRAALLPDKERQAIRGLLHQYIGKRLEFYDADRNADQIAAAERQGAAIQQAMWAHTLNAGKLYNTPLTAAFVTALNETFDRDTEQLAAMRNYVPAPVWVLLIFVAFCGVGITGYDAGASGKRMWFNQTLLPLLIATVITILVDLDSPRRGLVGISQESLIELEHNLGLLDEPSGDKNQWGVAR
ncbi:MAG: hypothetical protein RLZZ09_557 [Pseudomonadota bacterium]